MKNTNQEWLDCGEGTLYLEADGKHMIGCTTRVVELKGFGRILEVYDYSNTPDENFQLIVNAPQLRQKLNLLVKMVEDGDVTSDVMDECREVLAASYGKPV